MVKFFRLYISDTTFESNSMGIFIIFFWGTVLLYVLDFYKLVKRKSQVETAVIMSIPTAISVITSIFALLFLKVPKPGELDSFVEALFTPKICLELVHIVAVYVIIWMITYFSQKKRVRKDVRKWIISCVPDYCFGMGIIIATVCRFSVGVHFFTMYNQIFMWLYAYCIFLLSCKIILFTVGNLVRLYSMKITIFQWTEKKNPALFLAGYFYFCQNAILRNALLFELLLLVPLTIAIGSEWTYEIIFYTWFLYPGAIFVIAGATAPIRKGLNQFLEWGEEGKIKRMFCQEYFLEEALYKDDSFTVTRHFLVAEQHPADVYYWPYLRSVSSEILGKEGNCRELVFSDGKVYRFTSEELVESGEIFRYAQRYMQNREEVKGEQKKSRFMKDIYLGYSDEAVEKVVQDWLSCNEFYKTLWNGVSMWRTDLLLVHVSFFFDYSYENGTLHLEAFLVCGKKEELDLNGWGAVRYRKEYLELIISLLGEIVALAPENSTLSVEGILGEMYIKALKNYKILMSIIFVIMLLFVLALKTIYSHP